MYVRCYWWNTEWLRFWGDLLFLLLNEEGTLDIWKTKGDKKTFEIQTWDVGDIKEAEGYLFIWFIIFFCRMETAGMTQNIELLHVQSILNFPLAVKMPWKKLWPIKDLCLLLLMRNTLLSSCIKVVKTQIFYLLVICCPCTIRKNIILPHHPISECLG